MQFFDSSWDLVISISLERIALIVVLLWALVARTKYIRQIRVTQDNRVEAASKHAALLQTQESLKWCRDRMNRLSEQLQGVDEARYELREHSILKDKIIDDLERTIRDITANHEVEKRVAARLNGAVKRVDEARGNGAGEMRNDLALGEKIAEVFNLGELERMAFRLDVRFDNIPGDTLSARATELVGYMRRRGRLDEMLAELRVVRSHVRWGYGV